LGKEEKAELAAKDERAGDDDEESPIFPFPTLFFPLYLSLQPKSRSAVAFVGHCMHNKYKLASE
jgi:hypothetical protein